MNQSKLKDMLAYEPETGAFRWRAVHQGVRSEIAGHVEKYTGYRRIGIGHEKFAAHRLAFLYMTGKWPKRQVDHINGKKDDNRWANLREATQAENQQNQHRASRASRVGLRGVRFVGDTWRRKPYRAAIRNGGKQIDLGFFATAEEAHAAYVLAKRLYHRGAFNESNPQA